ncbi:MAG: hypothetical protein WCI47_03710 [bacterium]
MAQEKRSLFDRTCKDSNGKIVLVQSPNIPLWGWIVCKLLGYVPFLASAKQGLDLLGGAFLFVWAYLELTEGVNYLRRVFGLVMIVLISISYFSR